MAAIRPGYKTTEHAMAWAVIGLSAVALCRGQQAVERVSAMVAPAVASAAYAASRGRAKQGADAAAAAGGADPADLRAALGGAVADLFRQRSVAATGPPPPPCRRPSPATGPAGG